MLYQFPECNHKLWLDSSVRSLFLYQLLGAHQQQSFHHEMPPRIRRICAALENSNQLAEALNAYIRKEAASKVQRILIPTFFWWLIIFISIFFLQHYSTKARTLLHQERMASALMWTTFSLDLVESVKLKISNYFLCNVPFI